MKCHQTGCDTFSFGSLVLHVKAMTMLPLVYMECIIVRKTVDYRTYQIYPRIADD